MSPPLSYPVLLSCSPRCSRRAWIGLALTGVLASATGLAATPPITGEVVAVADGDTVTVRDATGVRHRVRLAGIDAPERGQAFGTRARRHLSALVFRQRVTVHAYKQDRYGRAVGRLMTRDRDAGLELVQAGLAWHDLQHAEEQSESDRTLYAWAEEDARSARRGVWSDPAAIPPWTWRRLHDFGMV